ncbi:MAG: hypothetical protein H6737_13905 [Alphaproteobacteria bacterium]|nr:hypothetical protein [Alphaproteobacteria bacterium]
MIGFVLVAGAWAQDVVGTWVWVDPSWGGSLTMDLRADGSGAIDGAPVRWSRDGGRLVLDADGERIVYDVQVASDSLTASGGDLDATAVFKRMGAAPVAPAPAPSPVAPAPAPVAPRPSGSASSSPIVGAWGDGHGGRLVFEADGTCLYVGQRLTYTYDGAKLVMNGPGGAVTMDVTIDGDRFVLRANGETQVLAREGSSAVADSPPAATAGVAGVYTVSESSIDSSNALVISQTLTLWPDGTVGWSKSEMGASRTAISDQLERFASFRNDPGSRGQTFGTWQANGSDVVVQWSIWNGLRCQGRIDPVSGALTLTGMGILNESATLTYQRQR